MDYIKVGYVLAVHKAVCLGDGSTTSPRQPLNCAAS